MQTVILYFVIISWFALNACEGQRHLVCKEMEDIFTTEPSSRSHVSRKTIQGSPGKRGPQGEKGETGDTGPQGSPAVVDYERIRTEVLERISPDITALETKIDGLTSRIIDMDESLLITEKRSNKLCEVVYNGKCFTAILHSTSDVNYAQAEELCSDIGWKLANIYDTTHYGMIVDYLRPKTSPSRRWISAFLGMTYNQRTRTAYYADGSTANIVGSMWYAGEPLRNEQRTHTAIVTKNNPDRTDQGIHTDTSWGPRHGSLCEL